MPSGQPPGMTPPRPPPPAPKKTIGQRDTWKDFYGQTHISAFRHGVSKPNAGSFDWKGYRKAFRSEAARHQRRRDYTAKGGSGIIPRKPEWVSVPRNPIRTKPDPKLQPKPRSRSLRRSSKKTPPAWIREGKSDAVSSGNSKPSQNVQRGSTTYPGGTPQGSLYKPPPKRPSLKKPVSAETTATTTYPGETPQP